MMAGELDYDLAMDSYSTRCVRDGKDGRFEVGFRYAG